MCVVRELFSSLHTASKISIAGNIAEPSDLVLPFVQLDRILL